MGDEPIYDYVTRQILDVQGANATGLVLLGSSLGAGAAEMVGGRLYANGYGDRNVFSFGVSSPGSLYSSRKFGYSVSALDESSIALLPRRDGVTMIDSHGGSVQRLECAQSTALTMDDCHSSANTLCELYSKCNRELFRNVTFMECLCYQRFEWDLCY